MLTELRITNLGVIKSAELKFGPGLNVLTGETGAGKTMILNALALALGGKVDSKLVRNEASKLSVEADWQLTEKQIQVLAELLEENTNNLSNQITFGRVIDNLGKSRQTIDGITSNASITNNFSENIIQVFGQSDQKFLSQPSWQIQTLDSFGTKDHQSNLIKYRILFKNLIDLLDQKTKLQIDQSTWLKEREQLQLDLKEFDEISPKLNEDEEILERIKQREKIEENSAALEQIANLLSPEDQLGLIGSLKQLRQITSSISELADLQEDIVSAQTIAIELEHRVFQLLTNESHDQSLSDLYTRKAQLLELVRKHRLPLNDLIKEFNEARLKFESNASPEKALDLITKEILDIEAEIIKVANEISKIRKEIAQSLSQQTTTELVALNMGKTRFIIEVKPISKNPALVVSGTNLNQNGKDVIDFLISNGESEPRLIAKSASGGELSRIMLALQVVLQQSIDNLVYVFDEVDAGIGGETAIEVGKRLAKLAANKQVIVVTHLPQVAAFADHHFCVKGSPAAGISTSDVVELYDDMRVNEIARMLGGMQTNAALTHAQELMALR